MNSSHEMFNLYYADITWFNIYKHILRSTFLEITTYVVILTKKKSEGLSFLFWNILFIIKHNAIYIINLIYTKTKRKYQIVLCVEMIEMFFLLTVYDVTDRFMFKRVEHTGFYNTCPKQKRDKTREKSKTEEKKGVVSLFCNKYNFV